MADIWLKFICTYTWYVVCVNMCVCVYTHVTYNHILENNIKRNIHLTISRLKQQKANNIVEAPYLLSNCIFLSC